MAVDILNKRDLEFLLYELFDAEALTKRPRYADHNKETFAAAFDTSITIAEKYLVPIRSKVDTNQPTFDGKKVTTLPEIKTALPDTEVIIMTAFR